MPTGSETERRNSGWAPGGRPDDGAYHAALASNTRRRVLDALAASAQPMDALAIAGVLELHVSTVRFHLEQLEEAHLVRRGTDGEKRRGRPRLLYTPVLTDERDETSREQLIGVLAGALADSDADRGRSRSIDAGKAWARALVPERADSGDRRQALLGVLDRLGFDPASDGDAIQLRGCPFRDAARQQPQVVCSVHLGLVRQLLDDGGDADDRPGHRVQLLPFVQPELCVINVGNA